VTTSIQGMTAGVVPVLSDAQRLAIARGFVSLTQGELADRLGVTVSTVQRAETGQTKVRRTTLMAWSLATGVNLHWLETGHAPELTSGGSCALCDAEDDGGAPSRTRTYDLRIKSP
jgi:transcriptional regulator with XRE-family HTH domain